jgi:alpha-tubulin suppressor-like RCC1 family protein
MNLSASPRPPARRAFQLGAAALVAGLTLLLPVAAPASQGHRGRAAAHRLIVSERCTLKARNKSSKPAAAHSRTRQACAGRPAQGPSPATSRTAKPAAPKAAAPNATAPAPAPSAPAAQPPAPISFPDEEGSGTGSETAGPEADVSEISELFAGESGEALVPGAVSSWGLNMHLDLGAGFKDPRMTYPVSTLNVAGAVSVSSAYNFGLALLSDGTVASWGGNSFGQLGDGDRLNTDHAVPVQGLTGVVAAAAGGAHGIALLKDGTVDTWGGDGYGQLGNGTYGVEVNPPSSSTVPLQVPGLTGVVAIAAGGTDDAAVLANGTVMMWGENKTGQVGDGTTVDKHVPTLVRGLRNVRAVALGGVASLSGHSLALLNDGTVMAWGSNGQGQSGGSGSFYATPVPVHGLSGVTAISASVSHSLALLGGQVFGWGSDKYHQLGVARSEACGESRCVRAPAPTGLSGASAVSAGWGWSMALQAGRVLSWGWNRDGQLGNGTQTDSATPVESRGISGATQIAAGERHSSAIVAAALQPSIQAVVGSRSITLDWISPQLTEGWQIAYRPRTNPATPLSKFVNLAAGTRTYSLTGLGPLTYEVVLRNKIEGNRIVRAKPLP